MDAVDKLKFKICVLGDASVGKTSLIHHFCEGVFRESYLSTIGVAFLTKTLNLTLENGRKAEIVLQIWDVAGQALFSQIRMNYLKGSQGSFILFDVTNKNTLMHLDAWISELSRALNNRDISKMPLLVIGNKIDLPHDNRLKERANAFVKNQLNLPIPITYTSAKTGEGMVDAFDFITRKMIESISNMKERKKVNEDRFT